MKLDPILHHRRSIRLADYDYSKPGSYFVTICTKSHTTVFGEVIDYQMHLSELGEIVNKCWSEMPGHFPTIKLDQFIVMPNHIHMIVVIMDLNGRGRVNPTPTVRSITLGDIVGGFKSISAMLVNMIRNTKGQPLWQRNYYEYIIRNENDLMEKRQYILDNPARWHLDRNNPINLKRRLKDPFNEINSSL
jgi:putative transposase